MQYECSNGYFKHTSHNDKLHGKDHNSMHIHDEYEVVYISKGTPVFFISGSAYMTKPGDIILMRGMEMHSIPSSGSVCSSRSELLFTPDVIRNVFKEGSQLLKVFDERPRGTKNHLRPDMHKQTILRNLLEGLDTPLNKKCGSHLSKAYTHFLNIIHIINEIHENSCSIMPVSSCAKDLAEVIRYIDSNIEQQLELNELGSLFFISPQHLIRIFKKYTSITVHDYIVCKRVIRAKELIRKGYSLESSLKDAGFTSYSGFYRAFKAKTGLSPKEYACKYT